MRRLVQKSLKPVFGGHVTRDPDDVGRAVRDDPARGAARRQEHSRRRQIESGRQAVVLLLEGMLLDTQDIVRRRLLVEELELDEGVTQPNTSSR
jgi:hypothetical protein